MQKRPRYERGPCLFINPKRKPGLVFFFNQYSDFRRHLTVQPDLDFVLAERFNGFFEMHLTAIDVKVLFL
jgi:hypothetical protein